MSSTPTASFPNGFASPGVAAADLAQRLDEKMLRLVCTLTIAFAVFYGAYFVVNGQHLSALIGAVGVTMCSVALAWARRTQRHRRALDSVHIGFFAVFAGAATLQDGVNSPALWWLLAPPFVALLTGSIRLGTALCGLFLLEIVLLLLHGPGSWGPISLLAPDPRVQMGLAIVMSTIYLSVIIASSARWTGQLRRALELANRTATAANAAKARFVSHLSHEIRTPLQGMIGAADMLGSSSIAAAEREQLVAVQGQSARTLLALVNNVLDFSKLEAGKMMLDPTPLQLRGLVFEINELFSAAAFTKGIDLTSSCSPDVPDAAIGDAVRIRQVLSNLVANAVKFTCQGGVHIHVGFDAADARRAPGATTPRHVRIEVADSGIGIDAARIETLFKPFHQADETVTRRYGGTGLGLSISRSLALLMGGRIEVTSRVGVGSVFALVVPLRFPDESMPHADRPERRGRALLATATNGLSRHVAGQLDELGIDAIVVDGVPDLVTLRQSRAQIVFVDSTLLRGNAGEATRRLDELTRLSVKVVVVLPLGGDTTCDTTIGTLLVYKPVRRSSLRALLDGEAQDACPAAAPEAAALPAAAGTTTTRISVVLVVDDDETNRVVVQSMLAGRGATVLTAADGQDALDALRREPIDLVLMDVQMPRLDGLAATRALRQREQAAGARRTPVVAMTGSGEPDERSACLEAGMDAFLIKPFRLEELRRTVDAFLLSRKIET